MSKDYTKANLRLRKIHERSLKKSYRGLSSLDKKIVKNREAWDMAIKELDFFWANTVVYKTSCGRKIADQDKTDWTLFYYLDEKKGKLSRQLKRLQVDNELSDADINGILDTFRQINLQHCYGGAF